MTQQLDATPYLLYGGVPPWRDTETSLAAAVSMLPHVSRLGGRVLAEIRQAGGLTCAEVEERLRLAHQTASARIRELALQGVIEDSGQRRRTPSGRRAIVWKEVCHG